MCLRRPCSASLGREVRPTKHLVHRGKLSIIIHNVEDHRAVLEEAAVLVRAGREL
jgi:hypothetical protein